MKKDLQELHRNALQMFDKSYSATQKQREFVTSQRRFIDIPGAQWSGSTNAGWNFDSDRFEKYPRFEINKVSKECNRIISEYRNNRITVNFRPKDSKTSEELANKLNGKFRADSEESGKEAFDNAFDNAVKGGMGCFRLDTELDDEYDMDNQERHILFKAVYDPERCVFFDVDSHEYDHADAMSAMELFSMSHEAFKAEYPDAEPSTLEVSRNDNNFDWVTPDEVYVGRYYYIKVETVTITRYINPITGDTADYDDEAIKEVQDELEQGQFQIVDQRKMKRRRVYCGLLSGTEWLEEPKRIPGEYIPLIPVYGYRTFIDGVERIEGHAAKAMDSQRLENLIVSMTADNATQASADNIPIIDVNLVPTALASHWAERNVKRPAFLPMKSLKDKDGNIVSQAQVAGYTPATPLSPALAGLLQYAGATTPQIMGTMQTGQMPSNMARDTVDTIFNRADSQSFIYMDNFAKSMAYAGKVWLCMAREVYGSDKEVRISLPDGRDKMVLMSGAVVDSQTGNIVALNDLSVGKYDVTVDVGLPFATRRDSTVKTLTTLLQGIPPDHPYYSVIMSMVIDNMDGEGLSDLKEYNRNQMLQQGVIKPESPEEQMMVQQAQMAAAQQPNPVLIQAQAQGMLAQAEMVKAQSGAEKVMIDAQKVQIDAFTAQSKAMVDNSTAALNLVKAADIDASQVRQALEILRLYQVQQEQNALEHLKLQQQAIAQDQARQMQMQAQQQMPPGGPGPGQAPIQ